MAISGFDNKLIIAAIVLSVIKGNQFTYRTAIPVFPQYPFGGRTFSRIEKAVRLGEFLSVAVTISALGSEARDHVQATQIYLNPLRAQSGIWTNGLLGTPRTAGRVRVESDKKRKNVYEKVTMWECGKRKCKDGEKK